MNRRIFLQSGLIGIGVLGAGAWVEQPMPRAWVPGHVENHDPSWGILNGAQVAADEQRGLMTASFTDMIRHMDGQTLSIGGFVLPLDTSSSFTHFVLTRRNSSCPFCPPNEPTEAVEVFAVRPIGYSPDEFTVTGQFHVIAESSQGLFYRFTNAHVRAGI